MKKQTIRDLYYGNISPGERVFGKTSEYGKLSGRAIELQEQFRDKVSAEDWESIVEMVQASTEAHNIELIEVFEDGFCLGARFILEVLDEPGEQMTNPLV